MKNTNKRKLLPTLGAALAIASLGFGGVAMAAPGLGNIDPDESASLTIHKYEGTPTGQANDGTAVTVTDRDPLGGVKFQACKVTGLDVHDPADWTVITDLNTAIQGTDEAPNPKHEFPTTGFDGVGLASDCLTGTTNAKGEISWGDSAAFQGVYYVTETDVSGAYKMVDGDEVKVAVAEMVLPFLVTVPMAHNSDNTWIYDVNVYPKNASVGIEKEAIDAGSVGVGSNVEWKVTNEVPTVQRDFDAYVLTDKLDPRVQYVADSTVLKLGDTTLALGTDYTFNATDHDATNGQGLRIDFTEAGLKKLDANNGETLTWTFKTEIISIGDGVIKNSASVLTNDPDNTWGTDENPPTEPPPGTPSEKVSSNWGALKINKYENTDGNKALSDAVFQVFASEADANACVAAVKAADGTLKAGCDDAISVTRDATGAEIAAPGQNMFTTGVDGTVVIPGLHTGVTNVPAKDTDSDARDYWLVEIVPPAGFVNANEVYKVNVTTGSIADAVVQGVPNAQKPPTTMPPTGAVVGAGLIIAAIVAGGGGIALIGSNRRKSEVK